MAPAMVREETRITILDSYDIVSSPLRELLHRRRGRSPEDEAKRNEYLKPGYGRGAQYVISPKSERSKHGGFLFLNPCLRLL